MKVKYKKVLQFCAVIFVFFLQLYLRSALPGSAPGMIPGGAASEPYVVVFSAILSGALVWGILEGLFWLYAKMKKK